MIKEKITEAVRKRILVSDGAWGTFLHRKGLQPGECPEKWCIDRPDDVLDIAKSYISAGADMIETNSFGGSIFKLDHYGLGGKVNEINEAAAKISSMAAGDNQWVIASMGPTGKMTVLGGVTEKDFHNAFRDQAVALEKGGADAICIETMSALDEAVMAIKAAKENTHLEVIATFTFEAGNDGSFNTMMGVSPADAATAAINAGADIIGTNCGNGFRQMIGIVKEMRKISSDIPILVHANAGLPKNVNGVDVFPETPEMMAQLVPEIIRAGANIIGGCCGTTPEHIKAIKAAVENI